MNKKIGLIVAAVILVAGGSALAVKNHSDNNKKVHDAMMAHDAAMQHEEAMKHDTAMAKEKAGAAMQHDATPASHGNYIGYADYSSNKAKYQGNKVVLYFHAPWCPICVPLDKDIKANVDKIPAGTTIVKADYDSSVALKKQYGVTYQHTMVQIDSNGKKIKKWSGGAELKDLLSQIQA